MKLTLRLLPVLGAILIPLTPHTTQATEPLPVAKSLAFQFLGTGRLDRLSPAVKKAIRQLGFNVRKLLKEFECYELDLRDPTSAISVGTAVDCVAPFDVPDQAPNLIAVEAKSFFLLPGGAFVNEGLTSVAPFTPGIGDAGGAFTHMTGSVPADGAEPTIVSANGEFEGMTGYARVSGAVNLSEFPPSATFNCLFQVSLDVAS